MKDGTKLGPKSLKNRYQNRSKNWSLLESIYERTLVGKMEPSWYQHGIPNRFLGFLGISGILRILRIPKISRIPRIPRNPKKCKNYVKVVETLCKHVKIMQQIVQTLCTNTKIEQNCTNNMQKYKNYGKKCANIMQKLRKNAKIIQKLCNNIQTYAKFVQKICNKCAVNDVRGSHDNTSKFLCSGRILVGIPSGRVWKKIYKEIMPLDFLSDSFRSDLDLGRISVGISTGLAGKKFFI